MHRFIRRQVRLQVDCKTTNLESKRNVVKRRQNVQYVLIKLIITLSFCYVLYRKGNLLKELTHSFAVVCFGSIPSSSVSLYREKKYSERRKVGVQTGSDIVDNVEAEVWSRIRRQQVGLLIYIGTCTVNT
jgi:hypothetical protein